MLAWPDDLLAMRAAVAGQIAEPLVTPQPDDVDRVTAPMRWLLNWDEDGLSPWTVSFTPSGRLAALSFLKARTP